MIKHKCKALKNFKTCKHKDIRELLSDVSIIRDQIEDTDMGDWFIIDSNYTMLIMCCPYCGVLLS